MLRKNFYVRRDIFYVRRDIFYVASPFPVPPTRKHNLLTILNVDAFCRYISPAIVEGVNLASSVRLPTSYSLSSSVLIDVTAATELTAARWEQPLGVLSTYARSSA